MILVCRILSPVGCLRKSRLKTRLQQNTQTKLQKPASAPLREKGSLTLRRKRKLVNLRQTDTKYSFFSLSRNRIVLLFFLNTSFPHKCYPCRLRFCGKGRVISDTISLAVSERDDVLIFCAAALLAFMVHSNLSK